MGWLHTDPARPPPPFTPRGGTELSRQVCRQRSSLHRLQCPFLWMVCQASPGGYDENALSIGKTPIMVHPPRRGERSGGTGGDSRNPSGYHKTQPRLARLPVLPTSQCEPRFEKQPQGQRFINVGETCCVSSEDGVHKRVGERIAGESRPSLITGTA